MSAAQRRWDAPRLHHLLADFPAAPGVPGADPSRPSTWWPAIYCDLPASKARRHGYSLPTARHLGDHIDAYVNHGQWVAECPVCHSAQTVTPVDPQFWCVDNCIPAWVPVDFPKDAERIEELLLARPQRENRNWHPWETVVDLAVENLDHGIDGDLTAKERRSARDVIDARQRDTWAIDAHPDAEAERQRVQAELEDHEETARRFVNAMAGHNITVR